MKKLRHIANFKKEEFSSFRYLYNCTFCYLSRNSSRRIIYNRLNHGHNSFEFLETNKDMMGGVIRIHYV